MSAETPWHRTAVGRFLGLVEGRDRALEVGVLAELEHRRLAAAHDERVEAVEVEVCELRRVLEQRCQFGRAQEAHRDQVVGRPLRGVARVRERVDLDPAAVGAGDGDLVADVRERVVGVRQLSGPEADRPAGRRGGRGVKRRANARLARRPLTTTARPAAFRRSRRARGAIRLADRRIRSAY
jgi:hypothetical protein